MGHHVSSTDGNQKCVPQSLATTHSSSIQNYRVLYLSATKTVSVCNHEALVSRKLTRKIARDVCFIHLRASFHSFIHMHISNQTMLLFFGARQFAFMFESHLLGRRSPASSFRTNLASSSVILSPKIISHKGQPNSLPSLFLSGLRMMPLDHLSTYLLFGSTNFTGGLIH